jgi:polyphosphate kinase 2
MDKPKDKAGKRQKAESQQAAFDFATFDIENPELPSFIEEGALASGAYPYMKRLKRKAYAKDLRALQIELLKLQDSMRESGERLVIVLEGRDAAGKGGAIGAFMQHLNPRHARVVALAKPSDVERGQWYFQRYAAHLPTAGDMVLFDRSWYNRAGVERVMGFCSQEQWETFLHEAPQFEGMLAREGIRLIKLFLSISRETQLKRLHTRHHDPLKRWKLSPIDLAGLPKWDEYSRALADMFRFTHSDDGPWTVIRANDKLRARLAVMRIVLSQLEYKGKDPEVVGAPDPAIVGSSANFFAIA